MILSSIAAQRIVPLLFVVSVGTNSQSAVVTVPASIAVQGTDVFSGPSFSLLQDVQPLDHLALYVDGTVDLAFGEFSSNAAGVIVAPATTNTGNNPGEISSGPGGHPFGALLLGNGEIGFFPIFQVDATTGLGSPSPPTSLALNRSFDDIFPAGAFSSLTSGTQLQFRVNDINTEGNSGRIDLTSIPGDFDADGAVDNNDLNLLLANWGEMSVPAEWVIGPEGSVDNDELNALLANWGAGVAAVPEPTAAILLLFAIATMGHRSDC